MCTIQIFSLLQLKTTDVAAELSFVLPSASTPQFPDLFTLLEGTVISNALLIHLICIEQSI